MPKDILWFAVAYHAVVFIAIVVFIHTRPKSDRKQWWFGFAIALMLWVVSAFLMAGWELIDESWATFWKRNTVNPTQI
jgi:hypothetical protein